MPGERKVQVLPRPHHDPKEYTLRGLLLAALSMAATLVFAFAVFAPSVLAQECPAGTQPFSPSGSGDHIECVSNQWLGDYLRVPQSYRRRDAQLTIGYAIGHRVRYSYCYRHCYRYGQWHDNLLCCLRCGRKPSGYRWSRLAVGGDSCVDAACWRGGHRRRHRAACLLTNWRGVARSG